MNKKLKPYLFILFVFLLVFFPVISFVFGLKNDILTGYLPVKFFISESISDGHFPWWNPYVNFGLPQHADMSSGFWNPVTWLISLTSGYSVYSITIELLLYIFIAGAGMYNVTGLWQLHKHTRLIAAVSYMCSGYIIGHIQHINWISGAAFLPWCFVSFMLMLRGFSFYRISIAVCCFYFFISSSHPGLIIGAFYFFSILFFYELISHFRKPGAENAKLSIQLLTLFVFVLLLITSLTGMIISYAEILPFITRGNKPAIANQTSSNIIQSLISFILPFSSTKAESLVQGSWSLKNFYMGITPLFFIVSSFLTLKKKQKTNILLFTGIFFLLISVTGIIQMLTYKYIPLLGYVRGPREFRIFAIFSFILVSAVTLNNFLTSSEQTRLIKKVHFFLFSVICLFCCWGVFKIIATNQSFIFANSSAVSSGNFRDYLKELSNSISFYDAIVLQGLFQLTLLILLKKYLFLKSSTLLLLVCITDIVVASTINLPLTGYGKLSAAKLQEQLNQSPKGIPIPVLQPIILNDTGSKKITSTIGAWSFYNKQPGTVIPAAYPIVFSNEDLLFSKKTMQYLAINPFIFFTKKSKVDSTTSDSALRSFKETSQEITIQRFAPSYIKILLKCPEPGYVTLMYQSYPHWKVLVNREKQHTQTDSTNFIKVYVPSRGMYTVEYIYEPVMIKRWFVVTIVLLSFLVLFICLKKFQDNLFKRQMS